MPNHPAEWSRMHIRPPRPLPATSGRISKKITLQNWCNFCGVAYMGRKWVLVFFWVFCFLPLYEHSKTIFCRFLSIYSYFPKNMIFQKIWSLFSAHIRAANITESENLFSPHICYTTQIAPILKSVFFWNSAGGGRKWPGWPDMHAGSFDWMIWHTLIKKIFWFHDFWRFYLQFVLCCLFWDSTVYDLYYVIEIA